MRKVIIRLMFIISVIVNFTLLVFVGGCVESEKSNRSSIVTAEIQEIFPFAVGTAEIDQGVGFSGRPDDAVICEVMGKSEVLGYCVDLKVIARSGAFWIRVLLDKQSLVKQASVVSYPFQRGRDVYKRAFSGQFEGKGAEDPIRVGNDIDAMTGATISSRVMADGVRRAVRMVKDIAE